MDDVEQPVVLESAARHGVTEGDALHAWAFAVDWYGTVAIVHAMPARSTFLR